MVRDARSEVARAPSSGKLVAYRTVTKRLAGAAGEWITKGVISDILVDLAGAHRNFGLSTDHIQKIIAEEFSAAAIQKDEAADSRGSSILYATQNEARSEVSWPNPTQISSTLAPVEQLHPELLPDAIRGYIWDVADRQQSPPDFAAVAAICAIAALVGNRVRISPKQADDWEVVPTLWGAIIGRPSAMKSPALHAALRPIYAIQDEQRKLWEEASKEAVVDNELNGMHLRDAKKKAKKALESGDSAGARSFLAERELNDGSELSPCPRLVVNDASVEKLGEILNENPRGVLVVRDELYGLLSRIESGEFENERAFYLEAFNGDGCFTYDRIGRGTVHIHACTLSIVGGIQPSRLAPMVRAAMSGIKNDGFIQRMQLAVWPDDLPSWRWVDRTPDSTSAALYEKVFRDLHGLTIGDTANPHIMRFSPTAQELFRDLTTQLQTEARAGRLPPTVESHILKMPKTIAALALLFELIDGGRWEVGEEATRRAMAWASYLRSHANRLYASGEAMAEDGARLIIERRQQLPHQFSQRDIYRKGWANLPDKDAVESAVHVLLATHHCREVAPVKGDQGGRPATTYAWHPSLNDEMRGDVDAEK
ncbi:DUF3987 domain-containing protein [Tardiphaga sp. vice352]|nr:DUF3987 domain-containing protein [Tardiphaga sp. vice304]QDM34597.1 DUF3987 domain-containing protein [Tardiphaga sp. vice352]